MRRLLVLMLLGISIVANSASLKSFSNKSAEGHCKKAWTKRGQIDVKMFDFCMNNQKEGYSNAKHYLKEYSGVSFLNEIVSYAQKKWLTRKQFDYSMVAYEIKQESEGFLDVEYDLKNGVVDRPTYKKCFNTWMKKHEPLWTMVKYCYRDR